MGLQDRTPAVGHKRPTWRSRYAPRTAEQERAIARTAEREARQRARAQAEAARDPFHIPSSYGSIWDD